MRAPMSRPHRFFRAYEIVLRLRVLPEIGSMRLSEVTRIDLQDPVDGLLASGLNESTISVTLGGADGEA
jgi:hypothetical protein